MNKSLSSRLIYPAKRVNCKDAHGRKKMLFSTEEKANNFIKFNGGPLEELNGKAPHHAYKCPLCDGYHLTSKTGNTFDMSSDTRKVIDAKREADEMKRVAAEKKAKEARKRHKEQNRDKELFFVCAAALAVLVCSAKADASLIDEYLQRLEGYNVAKLKKPQLAAVDAFKEAANADVDRRLALTSTDDFKNKVKTIVQIASSTVGSEVFRRLQQQFGVSLSGKDKPSDLLIYKVESLCDQLENAVADADCVMAEDLTAQVEELLTDCQQRNRRINTILDRLATCKAAIKFLKR